MSPGAFVNQLLAGLLLWGGAIALLAWLVGR